MPRNPLHTQHTTPHRFGGSFGILLFIIALGVLVAYIVFGSQIRSAIGIMPPQQPEAKPIPLTPVRTYEPPAPRAPVSITSPQNAEPSQANQSTQTVAPSAATTASTTKTDDTAPDRNSAN